MRKCIIAFIASLLLCASFAAQAMNNDEVLKLVKAGLSEALILQSIETAPAPAFDTSAAGLVALKSGGASDAVVAKILSRRSAAATASTATATATAVSGGACKLASNDVNLLAIRDGARQLNIGYRVAEVETETQGGSTLANIFTLGIASERALASAVIAGARSQNRIQSRRPVFPDLIAPTGQHADDTFVLVRLSPKGPNRAVVIGEARGNVFSYSEQSKIPAAAIVQLSLKKTQEGCTLENQKFIVYEGTPQTDMGPGEYAILYGDHVYDFAVE